MFVGGWMRKRKYFNYNSELCTIPTSTNFKETSEKVICSIKLKVSRPK